MKQKLTLRNLRESDQPLLLNWRNQERIREVSINSDPITKEEHEQWFNRALNESFESPLICDWDFRSVGIIQIEKWDPIQRYAMWGCYLGESDVIPGLGAALPFLAIDHAFNNIGARKLQAIVLSNNENMLRIHKRFGLREEGRFFKQSIRQSEEIDQIVYGIHNDEWPEIRKRILKLFPSSLRNELTVGLPILSETN